jgi:DNA-binding LacI/PurR family transcriptional regulator
MVYQVREYLSECSIAVPGDVQIIGYGGMSKSGMRAFSCYTIRIPVQEMAETAVNLVLGKVQSHPGTISLSVDFLPGKTTEGAQQ